MHNSQTKEIHKPSNILIIRNDKLGDFMLSYPVYTLLKQILPDTNIHVLVPEYTAPMAQMCQHIDNIIIDPGKQAILKQQLNLIQSLKQQQFSVVISLYSTTRIGIINYLAGIPYRLAPATKIAQIFYNHTLKQRRSESTQAEYQYNLDLVCRYLSDFNHPLVKNLSANLSPPYLRISETNKTAIKSLFIQQHKLSTNKKLIFIHPGSGGSANNLCNSQYIKLIQLLTQQSHSHIVVSFGPDETALASKFSTQLKHLNHTLFISQQGLENFAQHINIADIFISGSTGPLHIAGALDVATVAFYPNRRSATSIRWQTLNSTHKRLAFSPKNKFSEDMSSIDIDFVSKKIMQHYLL